MSGAFQYASHLGRKLQKTIFSLHTYRFKDVRCYVKMYPQEIPEQSARLNIEVEKLSIKTEARLNLLSGFFEVSKSTAQELLIKEPRLREVHKCDLFRNIQTLKNIGVSPDEVRKNLQLLYFCPLTVEHRISILNELGLQNLSAYHYRKFVKLYRSPVSLLKSYNLISSNYDIVEVLSYLNVPEYVYEDFKPPKNIDDLTISQVHRMLSFFYLCWYFECEQDSIDYIYNTYPPTQLKSLSLQKLYFKKLKENWNFVNEEILKHGFLFSGSPANLDLIEENVKHLAGADPKVVAHYTPRLLIAPYHRLCQIVNMLMELRITEAAVLQNPNIFTLHPQTIEERIKQLKETPEFAGLLSHPRVLRLIYFSAKAKNRLDMLRLMKDARSVPSLNILTGDQEKFDNYVALGYLRINRRDIVTFLSKELRVSSNVIRRTLRLPSQKHQSSLVSVKKNLAYFYKKGFSSEQIFSSMEVVLYPPELVIQYFLHLKEKIKVSSDQEIINNPNALQLLLYFLDKDVPY